MEEGSSIGYSTMYGYDMSRQHRSSIRLKFEIARQNGACCLAAFLMFQHILLHHVGRYTSFKLHVCTLSTLQGSFWKHHRGSWREFCCLCENKNLKWRMGGLFSKCDGREGDRRDCRRPSSRLSRIFELLDSTELQNEPLGSDWAQR
jgi:hypothetical protein